jgi:hypothetical protein
MTIEEDPAQPTETLASSPERLLREGVIMPAPVIDFTEEEGIMVPVRLRDGRFLDGRGQTEELLPNERALMTLLLHHSGLAISRIACELYGFGQSRSPAKKSGVFSLAKAGLKLKLASVKGGYEGLKEGPRVSTWPTCYLSGMRVVAGEGTQIIDSDTFLKMLLTNPGADPNQFITKRKHQQSDKAPSYEEIMRMARERHNRDTGRRNSRFS